MVTLVSCDKDKKDDVSPNVALLTAGEWRGSAVFLNGEDQTAAFEESNFYLSDYSAKFERDGSYAEYYDGNTLVDGIWEYENNERVIVFDKGTDNEYKVVISKLDDDELFYIQSGYEFRFVR